jgi:uncharacterized protein YaeQ
MALSATVYQIATELADIDRGVYETVTVRLARHPSETLDYMVTRFLAYCLEYTEGITLTDGVAAEDEPAVLVRDLTGRITAWIEVGLPGADRIHRGSKLAGRAAIYTHRAVPQVLHLLTGKGVHRAAEIPVFAFDREFVTALGEALERRSTLSLSLTERELYVEITGRHLTSTVTEHHFA